MIKTVLLSKWHQEHGEMTKFAGFLMPVRYSKIVDEHLAVRTAAGLFDVSHMGRVSVTGADTLKYLNALVPRDLERVADGKCAYTFLLNHQARFLDDLVLVREATDSWKLVWNAGNREKNWLWLNTFKEFVELWNEDLDVELQDWSDESVMFALQGPLAENILKKSLDLNDNQVPSKPWSFTIINLDGFSTYISRTGYTGEDGFEISIYGVNEKHIDDVRKIWEKIIETGKPMGLLPCGLGARDSLRLEAGYCLYGNDIDETVTLVEADLHHPPFVHVNKGQFFVGREQLMCLLDEEEKENKFLKKRVGIISLGRGPKPQRGTSLYDSEGKEVGHVTSGMFSPLLKKNIGMAYVLRAHSQLGTKLNYRVRGRDYLVEVTTFPFYDPEKYGARRKKTS